MKIKKLAQCPLNKQELCNHTMSGNKIILELLPIVAISVQISHHVYFPFRSATYKYIQIIVSRIIIDFLKSGQKCLFHIVLKNLKLTSKTPLLNFEVRKRENVYFRKRVITAEDLNEVSPGKIK